MVATVAKPPQKRTQNSAEETIFDRALPFNLEAEQGVLGSLLLLPECIDEIAEIVNPDSFHDESHKALYREIANLHAAGKKQDTILLLEHLKKTGKIETVGGPAYLGKVMHSVPSAAHVIYYAEIIRDKAILREMIGACTEGLKNAYADRSDPPLSVVAETEHRLRLIAENGTGATESRSIGLSVTSVLDSIQARARGEKSSGIPTGYGNLDDILGGLKPGQLIVLAGRPAMGKSAAALGIAMRVARHVEGNVYFSSQEMSEAELTERALCAATKISSYNLTNGTFTNDQRTRLIEASGEIASLRLLIDDTPGRSVFTIAANARKVKRKQGLSLVIIDYLQLLEPENTRDVREQQVAKMTRQLKCLARELEVPIVVLAQLNRQADNESSQGAEPKLRHLRESGAIEQDADVVIFVHRPAYYRDQAPPPQGAAEEALWIVAKQRGGRTGRAKMHWFGSHMSYEDQAEKWQEHDGTSSGPKRNEEFDDWNRR